MNDLSTPETVSKFVALNLRHDDIFRLPVRQLTKTFSVRDLLELCFPGWRPWAGIDERLRRDSVRSVDR